MTLPPLSLYVHLPWCVRKCPYCDFNSYTAGRGMQHERYVTALLADLRKEAPRVAGREVVSIFMGGGTPSLFPAADILRLLDGIAGAYSLADGIEITMEANPGTVESGAPAGYRAAGVNRLSIGAQSFSAQMLDALGRIHTPGDIERAMGQARAAGFDNVNLDIMHELPGQDVDGALDDLEQALSLEPEHISWYELTLEPNTVFHARPPAGLPAEDMALKIETGGAALLESRGYERYEVSAYALPGRRCRHNLNYWHFGDYIGVGAGAHGKLSTADGVFRSTRPANPLSYLAAIERGVDLPPATGLGAGERLFEYLLNALRLEHGFDESEFAERARLDPGLLAERAAPAVEKGLIVRSAGGHWTPTGLGRRFLNDLQSGFLP